MPSLLEVPFRPLRLEPSLKQGLAHNIPEAALWTAEVAIVIQHGLENPLTLVAKIDTGAPLTLLPKDILPYLDSTKSFEHDLYGVVKHPACRVPVTIGIMDFDLEDLKGVRKSFEDVPVAVSHLPNTPILLGIAGILENATLAFRMDDCRLIISWSM